MAKVLCACGKLGLGVNMNKPYLVSHYSNYSLKQVK